MNRAAGRLVGLLLALSAASACAAPVHTTNGPFEVVQAATYRIAFRRDTFAMTLDLKKRDGGWLPVTKSANAIEFGVMDGPTLTTVNDQPATLSVTPSADTIYVGRNVVLEPIRKVMLRVDFICTDAGVLVGTRVVAPSGTQQKGVLWSPPRLSLNAADWTTYAFYSSDGRVHAGNIAELLPFPAYAGVSAWERNGDTSDALDPAHPALILRSATAGAGLCVAFVRYAADWRGVACFYQRYTGADTYLYAGYADAAHDGIRWAWLAPVPYQDAQADTRLVERLVATGATLTEGFVPSAPPIPAEWLKPVPDFPSALRRSKPVADIRDAAVFTVNEGVAGSPHGLDLARKVGSDMLIRAWFKWAQASPFSNWKDQPQTAHALGALFGGGITCSALYDGENGITREQLLDMATRDAAGNLVDAWDTPGIRHGSLSSPAYLDYLFRWCREQIDAGADYLFMDEHQAALSGKEGYDDHSLADFRGYLLTGSPQTRGWKPDDARWLTVYGVDLKSRAVCPSGSMDSFQFREYLRTIGVIADPAMVADKLFGLWGEFRTWRDDRAWKALTDRIRAYAKERGRTVLISANGIAKYVDLQVLGVWDNWTTDNGHVDLRANLLQNWRAQVVNGHDMAGKDVPVVLFHDWGFGETPFPWMAVPASERTDWMRTRGAEIYASGGFFAFPVEGPFGCDAGRDGTLSAIAHLTEFYQRRRGLYLKSRWLGSEAIRSETPLLSLAASWNAAASSLVVHVINRDVKAGVLRARGSVRIGLPVASAPRSAVSVSPDFAGERAAACKLVGTNLQIDVPALDAYTVVLLKYDREPDFSRLKDPVRIRLAARWNRPVRSEFRVQADGSVENAADLEGFLQGMLHGELRNPPTFLVNVLAPSQALVRVRAVSTAGARLRFQIDGAVVKTLTLPDKDGKNDGSAHEYDQTYTCPIPIGRHRLTVDNVGGDWAVLDWYEFVGKIGKW